MRLNKLLPTVFAAISLLLTGNLLWAGGSATSVGVNVQNVGADMATFVITSTQGGTGYFTLLSGFGVNCGTVAQIQAGLDANGKSATARGSLPLSANIAGNYTVRNLLQQSAYTACFTDGGVPALVSSLSFTTQQMVVYSNPMFGLVGTPTLPTPPGGIFFDSLAIAPDGTPYMEYGDGGNGNKATVMKYTNATGWVAVGATGFSAGGAAFPSLVFAPDGTLYLAYMDEANGSKATVMKYDGSAWTAVGTTGFSADSAVNISLAFAADGTPCVAYSDGAKGGAATVMKYDGVAWTAVGTAGFSAGQTAFTSLAFASDGTPYVAYTEYNSSPQKATVMKYNGSAWVAVGSPGFSAGGAYNTSLAFAPDNTPYVAYSDFSNGHKATVMKYNGLAWVPVGIAGFSVGAAAYTDLLIGADGTPYVTYQDESNYQQAVMKYNGTAWVSVGVGVWNSWLNVYDVSSGYGSLALAPDGTPYVSYLDNSLSAAKAAVIRLGNQSNLVVSSSANPSVYGAPVTFTALLSPSINPSGTVLFKSDGNPIADCGTNGMVNMTAGRAVCTTSSLSLATQSAQHQIIFEYIGDGSNVIQNNALIYQAVLLTQTISFGTAPTITVGATGSVTATGGASGNPVVFYSENPGICTVTANGVVTGITAGTCIIGANQLGGGNYMAAHQVNQSFTIGKGSQAISFNGSPYLAVGGTVTISVTGGNSGNPVTLFSSSPSICSVAGNVVTDHVAGTCSIYANQAGNNSYNAAPTVWLNINVGIGLNSVSIATSENINGIVWSGSQFVAVGNAGIILTSPDGSHWIFQNSPVIADLIAVAWLGDQFVAVGAQDTVLSSPDGINWSKRFADNTSTARLLSIANAGGGNFFAVGDDPNHPNNGVWLLNNDSSASPSSWTPTQAVANYGQFESVTWGGNRFVAVGSNGGSSALVGTTVNGSTVNTVQPAGIAPLHAVAWTGSQFVAVGDYGTIVTSPDGNTWTAQSSGTSRVFYAVIWTGSQFVVVGQYGAVLTSTDGINWVAPPAGTSSSFTGAAWSGSQLVVVGTNGTVMTGTNPWGGVLALANKRWLQVGLPANPAVSTVGGVFGGVAGAYNKDWVLYKRDANANSYAVLPNTAAALDQSTGYFFETLKGPANIVLWNGATATPLVTSNNNCPSTAGCYEIPLFAASDSTARANLVNFPLPYPVGWWDVRVQVTANGSTTVYTPSAAETAGYLQKTYYIWNGTSYDTFDDSTPGKLGVLQPWQSIWVKVLPGSSGKTVKLLVPAIPKLSMAPAQDTATPLAVGHKQAQPWLAKALDWLVPAAEAAPVTAVGVNDRTARMAAEGLAIQQGHNWYVRLVAQEPTQAMRDRNAVFGQLDGSGTGSDNHDLSAMAPFGTPYLQVAFPHPEWGAKAGDYVTDFRPVKPGTGADQWTFEVRSDTPRKVLLKWEAPQAVLDHSVLVDVATGQSYSPGSAALQGGGLWITLTGTTRRFTWNYLGH